MKVILRNNIDEIVAHRNKALNEALNEALNDDEQFIVEIIRLK